MDFAAYYDLTWLRKADYFRIHRRRFLQTWDFLDALELPKSGIGLEVGGISPLGAYLRDNNGWSVESTTTDLRQKLDLDGNRFDLAICTETIEHIKDVDTDIIPELAMFNYSGILMMLSELHRVLKTGGNLLITTPNANSYVTLHKWLGGELLLLDPQHVREFSVADLKRVTNKSGFHLNVLKTINSWEDQIGGHVKELRALLEQLPQAGLIQRDDNIIAAFIK